MITMGKLSRLCCDFRKELEIPFTLNDGYIYATNGKWIVRVREREGLSTTHVPCKANFKIFEWGKFNNDAKFFAVPRVEDDGLFIDCVTCGGSGTIQCNLGHDHDCPNCDCAGKQEAGIRVEAAGFKFNSVNMRALQRELGKIEIMEKKPEDNYIGVFFRFEDGAGIIQPKRSEG